MRQIKFRAWHIESKKMISWNDIIRNKELLQSFFGNEHYATNPPRYFYERMQFTGLLDCEGKEVFEGDVLEVTSNNDGQKYITTFKVDLINGLHIDTLSLCMDICLYDYEVTSSNCKIIGNLYEHPQLLNND